MAHRPAPAATARRDCPQRNGDPVTRDRREKITRPPRPTAIHAAPSPRINERPEIPGINLPHIPVNAAAITPGTRESTLATGGQNGASRAAPRPGGNQPILGLASIERSPPPATRESTGLRIHASTYPQAGNAAAKRQGITRGRRSPSPETVSPKRGTDRAGNAPPAAQASSAQSCQRTAPPRPAKRGSTTKNRNDSDTITHPPPSRGTWMPYSPCLRESPQKAKMAVRRRRHNHVPRPRGIKPRPTKPGGWSTGRNASPKPVFPAQTP